MSNIVLSKEDFCHYNIYYKNIWWPRCNPFYFYQKSDFTYGHEPWWFKYRCLNWCVRCFWSIVDYIVTEVCANWLFDFKPYGAWDSHITPSFADAFSNLWNNVIVFLTPWYRIRFKFLEGFTNCNGSKALSGNRYYSHVRNRVEEMAYYTLTFTGFHYKLIKMVLRDAEGRHSNAFLSGISIALSDKSEEEKQKEIESYKEEFSTVCTGWVFGWRSAVRELNKIVKLTPDLQWFS